MRSLSHGFALPSESGSSVMCSRQSISRVQTLWNCLRRHFRGTGLAELLDKQDRASRLKLGMWQGSFQDPGIWRKQQASA